jgi:hypothetical protein
MDCIHGLINRVPSFGFCNAIFADDIAILTFDGNEFTDGNDDSDSNLVSDGMGSISDVDRTFIDGAGLI